jgi:hypothetical protein
MPLRVVRFRNVNFQKSDILRVSVLAVSQNNNSTYKLNLILGLVGDQGGRLPSYDEDQYFGTRLFVVAADIF